MILSHTINSIELFEIIEMSNDIYIEKMLTNWSTLYDEYSTQG